jgi:hypothetical protein
VSNGHGSYQRIARSFHCFVWFSVPDTAATPTRKRCGCLVYHTHPHLLLPPRTANARTTRSIHKLMGEHCDTLVLEASHSLTLTASTAPLASRGIDFGFSNPSSRLDSLFFTREPDSDPGPLLLCSQPSRPCFSVRLTIRLRHTALVPHSCSHFASPINTPTTSLEALSLFSPSMHPSASQHSIQ